MKNRVEVLAPYYTIAKRFHFNHFRLLVRIYCYPFIYGKNLSCIAGSFKFFFFPLFLTLATHRGKSCKTFPNMYVICYVSLLAKENNL